MIEDEANLAASDASRLRQIVFDRLHGLTSIGPTIDPRYGEEPFEWLAAQFLSGQEEMRDRFVAILGELLDELPDAARWPAESRNNLLALVQLGGTTLGGKIFRALSTGKMLRVMDDYHLDCHAGLLKCMIAQGRGASRRFWLKQLDLLGAQYGALIFSGLVMHGLNTAVNSLPRLCITEESIAWIRLGIPSLVSRFGMEAVADAFSLVASRLLVEARNEFQAEINFLRQEIVNPSHQEGAALSAVLDAGEIARIAASEFRGLDVLTARQRELYNFIRSKIQGRGYGPTVREIGLHFQIKSPNGVLWHLKALQKKGLIHREPNMSRGIQLLEDPVYAHDTVLKLVGRIAAGQPIEAVESYEQLTFTEWAGHQDVVALQVVGDSMSDEHIGDGDYAIIRRQNHAENGQIVVMMDDDGGTMLKRVYRERARFRIEHANRSMKPIYRDNITIIGVLVGMVRFYDRSPDDATPPA
jgi:repressor LexA